MKKTTKVILSSALTMGLCASLIAGSTLAMFSSRSNVNVAITSGKVDVVASVDTDSLTGYSTEWDESVFEYVQKPTTDLTVKGVPLPANTFLAGGTYTYEAGALKLDSIAPGDAVEFKLNIENNSTLAIQYRVQLTVPTQQESGDPQDEIVKELQISFDGGDPVTIGDESTFAQPWSAVIDKGVEITETPKVRIELPREVEGDGFEDQSCLLHVGVYAVQLGTHVADAEGTYNAHTAADFLALSNLAESGHTFAGETIALGADINLSPDSDGGASTLSIALADTPATIAETSESQRVWIFGCKDNDKGQSRPFKGTLDGNGYTISGFKTPDGNPVGGNCTQDGDGYGYGLFRYTDGATIKNLVIENAMIRIKTDYQTYAGDSSGYAGIIAGQAKDTTFENITVRNSKVISLTDYNKKIFMYSGFGGRIARTVEEAANEEYTNQPIVCYDFVGAIAGQIIGTTKVENVNIDLNEAVSALTGIKIFGNTPNFGPEQEYYTKEYDVAFTGTSTVVCTSDDGFVETLTFTSANDGSQETATAAHPTADVGSKDALSALAQSVADGRDFEDVTITLTDDIDLAGSDLSIESGEFKGTIEGNGKIVSGLKIGEESIFSGANVNNAKLQFTTDATTATVGNPDSELETIAANYKNTTVTVANGDASYTITYGEAGVITDAAFNGNSFEEAQTLAAGIAYSFDGVTFSSLNGTAETQVTLANSIFGTASEAIMLADVSPVLNVTLAEGSVLSGNTFYGDVTVNGTATLNGNTVTGTLTLGGSVTLVKNTLTTVAMEEGAMVLFIDGNTIDGEPVSYQENWKESGYTFVGWNIVFNNENKIQSGTVALGENGEEAWNALLADDAEILTYDVTTSLSTNQKGQIVLASPSDILALNAYVYNAEQAPTLDVIVKNNIDMTGVELTPWSDKTKTATGTIEGNNKVIYGLSGSIKNSMPNTVFFNMSGDYNIKNLSFVLEKESLDGPDLIKLNDGKTYLNQAKMNNVFFLSKQGEEYTWMVYCYNVDGTQNAVGGSFSLNANMKSIYNGLFENKDGECGSGFTAEKKLAAGTKLSGTNKARFDDYLNAKFSNESLSEN